MANVDFSSFTIKNIVTLCEVFKPIAKRYNISAEAVFILYALNYEIDLSFLVKDEFVIQLINNSFAEKEGEKLKITGKGGIIAKSLDPIIVKEFSKFS